MCSTYYATQSRVHYCIVLNEIFLAVIIVVVVVVVAVAVVVVVSSSVNESLTKCLRRVKTQQ